MGLLDKVGKGLKELGKGVVETGMTIKKGIDDNIEIQRKKRTLLNRFSIKDLKKICYDHGIGEPSEWVDTPETILTGKQEKRTLTKNVWINYIQRRLNLNDIEEFCHKHRIATDVLKQPTEHYTAPSQPVIREEEPLRTEMKPEPVREVPPTPYETPRETPPSYPSGQSELHEILKTIKEQFKPEPCINEKELQGQLKIWLDVKYPNRATREVATMAGKVDIVIDKNKYGIEVKIANDKGTLRNLVGQILAYKKYFREVGIVLLDVSELQHSIIHEYINEYQNQGVETVLIHGQLRRRKGRPREIRVKY
jgi:hypothetical protein